MVFHGEPIGKYIGQRQMTVVISQVPRSFIICPKKKKEVTGPIIKYHDYVKEVKVVFLFFRTLCPKSDK